jgi:hypothetical protein
MTLLGCKFILYDKDVNKTRFVELEIYVVKVGFMISVRKCLFYLSVWK